MTRHTRTEVHIVLMTGPGGPASPGGPRRPRARAAPAAGAGGATCATARAASPGFLGRGPRAGRGDVRAAILALLAEEPMHGYQIMRELGERSGGVWRPSPGSIYPTLQQLEDEELVRPETGDGGRRVFALTDAGREAPDGRRGRPRPLGRGRRRGRRQRARVARSRRPGHGRRAPGPARRRARADRAGQGRAARHAPQALPHPRRGLPGDASPSRSRRRAGGQALSRQRGPVAVRVSGP